VIFTSDELIFKKRIHLERTVGGVAGSANQQRPFHLPSPACLAAFMSPVTDFQWQRGNTAWDAPLLLTVLKTFRPLKYSFKEPYPVRRKCDLALLGHCRGLLFQVQIKFYHYLLESQECSVDRDKRSQLELRTKVTSQVPR
jgi:hypothetical protein